jgi:hypothetical protein
MKNFNFFVGTDKVILKSMWKLRDPIIAKTILKRTRLEDSDFPISKLYAKL